MAVVPTHLVAVVARLRVDSWAVEVIGAMRERGIRALLLKGPSVSRWLYPEDPGQRSYTDVDLLVSPADTDSASELLAELGFAVLPHPRADVHAFHALPFQRSSDGANVDLHRSLHGLQDVPSEAVWRVVSSHTETIRIGNLDVEIPGTPVRILHLVLHLSHGDRANSGPWRDLERAVKQCTIEEWRAAVAIARQVGVENEFAVRLRRLPEGSELADELGLTSRGSRYFRLRKAIETGRAPGSSHSIWAFTVLPDTRSRVSYVRRKLLPDRETLLEQYALARRGHITLAKTLHIARVFARLPGTLIGWARHYRE